MRQVGTFTSTDDTTATATDVWFTVEPAYTIANEWLDITDESILALPDLQGYGTVYDLHQAMVRDTSGDLEDLVQAFVDAEDAATRNALDSNDRDLVDNIILKWTGADGYSQDRGPCFDAKKLAAMEATRETTI